MAMTLRSPVWRPPFSWYCRSVFDLPVPAGRPRSAVPAGAARARVAIALVLVRPLVPIGVARTARPIDAYAIASQPALGQREDRRVALRVEMPATAETAVRQPEVRPARQHSRAPAGPEIVYGWMPVEFARRQPATWGPQPLLPARSPLGRRLRTGASCRVLRESARPTAPGPKADGRPVLAGDDRRAASDRAVQAYRAPGISRRSGVLRGLDIFPATRCEHGQYTPRPPHRW